ncbi:hypothetical protein SanaruYs_35590 [Chryseotalea sanaruensis]|uniref:Uncharacterized protein n=1 Tax=Chryseotalea sanaruensis TaxID=2482724 RepID=A0A401UEI9_9BACT|nr:hypothetical protein [Chryseotalea sanaruensis]GCC53316.1 hypothetical protein SanaruYs_35590 [Chryseotalea sanaruensis]
MGQKKGLDSFSHLDSLKIPVRNFCLPNSFIKFDPKSTTTYGTYLEINLDTPINQAYSVGNDNIKLIKTKINSKDDKQYYISFGSIDGPSIGFTIFEAALPNKIIGQIQAISLIIPGNGSLYSIDRCWENYITKRKHSIVEGKIMEDKQPFYSVDIKSYALRPIEIYADATFKDKMATIPINGKIEIILCTGSNSTSDIYLVRTSFGLLGWARLRAGQYQSVDVEGLFYNGD